MTVSARSNRELSQFWSIILAAVACLLIGVELVVTPVQKASQPADQRAGDALVTRQNAQQSQYTLPATG